MNRTRSIFFSLLLQISPQSSSSSFLTRRDRPSAHSSSASLSLLSRGRFLVVCSSELASMDLICGNRTNWRVCHRLPYSLPPSLSSFRACLMRRTPLMASLPLSLSPSMELHSPSGRARGRSVRRSDLRTKREQKRLAHTHKSETLTPMFARVDLQRKNWRYCYAFKI